DSNPTNSLARRSTSAAPLPRPRRDTCSSSTVAGPPGSGLQRPVPGIGWGKLLRPEAGDVGPCCYPDIWIVTYVREEALQRTDAAGSADDPGVQSDRHHARSRRTFMVQDVGRVPAVLLELGGRLHIGSPEPKVADVNRLLHDHG